MSTSSTSERLTNIASSVGPARAGAPRVAWWLLLLVAVALVPSVLRIGRPVWGLSVEQMIPVLAPVLALLLGGLCQQLLEHQVRRVPLWVLISGIQAVSFGGVFAALWWSTTPVSRLGFAIAFVIGLAGALLDALLHRFRWSASAILALAVAAIVHFGSRAESVRSGQTESLTLVTEYYRLSVEKNLLVPAVPAASQAVEGGALAVLDDLVFVATVRGDLFGLRWDQSESLKPSPLPLSVPVNWRQFQTDQPTSSLGVRVTGLAARMASGVVQLFAAYDHWNGSEQCFTTRVARAELQSSADGAFSARNGWHVLFESRPCLKVTTGYDFFQTGGRLALRPDGTMLLSLGDRGINGLNGIQHAQDPSTDYGKVLILNQDGTGARAYTIGHRNPQGLAIDASGGVWETEHGPQGGDEINRLVPDANYGWPLVSYGTDYGHFVWPFSPEAKSHGKFSEPAYVFVPAIGISNLTTLTSRRFPMWIGDLLVASLRAKTLFRVRHLDGRVIYAEPIVIGHRIRDLVQTSDGRIVLWTDDGYVIGVGLARSPALYDRCSGCHEPAGGNPALGPPLRGIFGSKVANFFEFNYSQALRRAGGKWTEARLDDFLRDPAAFAPGTTMTMPGLSDAAERDGIIDFLKRY